MAVTKILNVQDHAGNKITGVGTPTLSTDAATKAYVDTDAVSPPSLIQALNSGTQATWATSTTFGGFNYGHASASGNILVSAIQITSGNTLAIATPTGWSLLAGSPFADATNTRAYYLYTRTADGTNTDHFTPSMTNSGAAGNSYSLVWMEFTAAGLAIYGAAIRVNTAFNNTTGYSADLVATAGSLAVCLIDGASTSAPTGQGWRLASASSAGPSFGVFLMDIFSARTVYFMANLTTQKNLMIFGVPHA